MHRAFLAAAFLLSIFTLPWWVTVLAAIAYLAEGGSALLVIVGGVILDALFGAPILALHGFAYLYTALMLILSLAALLLRRRLFD